MKKLLAVLTFIILNTAMLATPAAADDAETGERVEHYEAEKIENVDQARKALGENNDKIAEILKAEELSGAQLEEIHRISYTLETAIDRLIAEEAAAPSRLEAVDEAVQAVHNNSENHEEAMVREWFAKLKAAVDNLDTAPVASATEKNVYENVYEIVIKDHSFSPDEIHIPAGEKIKLIIHNQDPTPEEFESDDFRREKIIPGNSSATILVGPLEPGKYHFFGEFNLDKANGYLIAE